MNRPGVDRPESGPDLPAEGLKARSVVHTVYLDVNRQVIWELDSEGNRQILLDIFPHKRMEVKGFDDA